MSNTPLHEPPAQGLSSGSGQTLPSRLLQPIPDPSASKRVCFYKSGDNKFGGHRMVINARTFKTFDALLDALSKKVPLPFGVRTITTPRGTHLVKGLDDLHDGGSYVCSDRRRVKPLNLDEVNRRQVPWNTTRPLSAVRRKRKGFQFGGKNEVINRPTKISDRVAVRTPKKLVVIKNRDPTVKRTIVLQRRTAPTFEALLDYLSQVLQFPVQKLYSADGRRIDGLAALILCNGVVVAAGSEPFRLTNYSFNSTGQMAQAMYMDTVESSMVQAQAQNNRSYSSGRGSRNFSLSSERYIVNQINNSRNGSTNSQLHHHEGSYETEVNQRHTSMESYGNARVDNEHQTCIVPQDDDIEKSFRVNQDGSMTVEMKVRLTIKEEEMLHWTTTLSRSSLTKRAVFASISESGNSSPDSNNAVAKDSSSVSDDEAKEENHPTASGEGISFNKERVYEGYTSTALGKAKTSFKRAPTPGPRHVKKNASIESVKMVTQSGVQESTLGHYSYMERTADGEATEGYCLVRHTSSSSNRPVPKPRKTASAGASKKSSHSSIRSSGVAEVLQIQNNGMEVRETVMHIYESQGCYNNYFANEEHNADGVPLPGPSSAPDSKPSTDSGPRSSSNDCDIDWQPPTADSLQRLKEEMLSLSSEPLSPTQGIPNNLSSLSENETQTATNSRITSEKKKVIKTSRKQKSSPSTGNSDKKQKENLVSSSKNSKHSSLDKISSNASVGKKSLSSLESAKSGQKSKAAERPELKKSTKDEKIPRKESALSVSSENMKRTPPKTQNINKAAAKDNGHNVNTPTGRPQMKKNMLDILQPKKSLLPGRKQMSKPKSMIENRILLPKKSLELSESVSMPSLNPSPSEIHQYVENWLEKVSPDQVPYMEDTDETEPKAKVVFKIGGDSDSSEKSDCQSNPEEYYQSPGDAIKKSVSCLSVPFSHEGPTTVLPHNDQKVRGLCVSMPSVRVDPAQYENRLKSHKSAENIGPDENLSSSSTSNILSPKAKIKPVLRQICSSIQCIRSIPDTNKTSNLEKSNSLPDFSSQVASVFGSSCKALLSFLSVMTLRENLTGPAPSDGNASRSSSEAMLMLESLQKISTIDDQEELRASLTDLESKASSHFRERWKDFQIQRERLESEPLSPKFSETEFALDVLSEGGDVFDDQHMGIDELMEELNMPQDLREEISSTIQHARSFYPVDESTFIDTEKNHSDSEEDVEQFVKECKQSPEPENTCMAENISETRQGDDEDPSHTGDIDDIKEMQNTCYEQPKMMTESEQDFDVKESDVSQPEIDKENEGEIKEEEEEVEENMEAVKEIDDGGGGETENEEREREEEAEEEALREDDVGQEVEEGCGVASVENEQERMEEEMTFDEEEEQEKLEKVEKEVVVEETEDGFMDEEDEEAREYDNVAETDERDSVEEKEEEEEWKEDEEVENNEEMQGQDLSETNENEDKVIEETDEEKEAENNIEGVEEEEEGEDIEGEADEVIEERDEEEENIEGVEEEEEEGGKEEETEDVIEERDDEVENIQEVEEEEEDNVEEEAEEAIEETDEEVENIDGVEEEEEEEDEEGKEEEAEDVNDERGEGVENIELEEEEEREGEEEDAEDVIEEGDDEVENIEEMEEEQEGEDVEEEVEEVIEEKDEEVENIEEVGEEEEEDEEGREEDAEDVIEEGNDEVENIEEVEENEEEENVEEEAEEAIEERDEEVENIEGAEDEEEEEEEGKEEEEEDEDVNEERDDEIDNIEEVEGEEEEKDLEEEAEEVIEETDEVENIPEEVEEEDAGEVEEKDEEEVVSEENNEEEEGGEEEDGEIAMLETIEEVMFRDEEEEKAEFDKDLEVEEMQEESDWDKEELEKESIEEKEVEEDDMELGQTLGEEEGEDDVKSESNELNDGCERESNEESEEENVENGIGDDTVCKSQLEEATYLRQKSSSCEEDQANYEEANTDIKEAGQSTESPTKHSSEGQCEDDKGNGTDTVNEVETDEGGECYDERNGSLPHPVEISQELLDFVNSALQSSSLIFIYDDRGNIRIEPDNVRVAQTKQIVIPQSKNDSLYGLKRLPSPSTSDLSDYRPETSESGGYKTQESVDIVSESGDEASERHPPVYRHSVHRTERANVERAKSSNSKLSVASNSEVLQRSRLKSGGSFSSRGSGTKASREDLSYFSASAASSLKADAEAAMEAAQCISFGSDKDSNDGVLIDKGRWLLKENHLIRKSPPISLGMYGNLDSTSLDTGQENTSEEAPAHYKIQNNPLAAISSSELEEMAKPQTPKCTYYNMPHGSDSDPFLDDVSLKSGKKDSISLKGRGFRVSPTVDTTKTWANKNGSLSSFASVEFKLPDRKVHPEGESSAVTQARRTSGAGGAVLQSQDSLDTLHVRCGQYCPIL